MHEPIKHVANAFPSIRFTCYRGKTISVQERVILFFLCLHSSTLDSPHAVLCVLSTADRGDSRKTADGGGSRLTTASVLLQPLSRKHISAPAPRLVSACVSVVVPFRRVCVYLASPQHIAGVLAPYISKY